ncbi:hypothetical protein BaRGS_00010249 [Batillaria attramentaria]|uniref:Protein TBATA n=1 Tax=Batillaria attramentaria TaxID=370345 RepID=A0ABD0LGH1_9CAEN
MTTSEVYRPTDGDLLIRDNIAEGPSQPADLFQKRPSTQSGYRFGQLSHNSFFTRHNPHPHRVRHLKGLLDVPICSVNDDGYFASPRYSLQFPPNNFNNTKLNKWKGRIPVNAINVNSQLHPINTITGLQYFMGLNSYPWRERAMPKVGLVPVTEAWRDELKRFTEQLGVDEQPRDGLNVRREEEQPRPRTTMYSPDTGRLIPPPSRAMSRGASRRGYQADRFLGPLQHIAAEPDLENTVLTMLCQILQTEDINAVQAWLCSAGEREKTMVMDMIKAAMAGREEYWKQYPAQIREQPLENDRPSKLPPINGAPRPSTGEINRLVLEDGAAPAPVPPQAPKSPMRPIIEDKDFTIDPPTNEVFRPPSPPKKPASQQAARAPSAQPPAPEECNGKPQSPEPRLKYTKSPVMELAAEMQNMWAPNQSVNTF